MSAPSALARAKISWQGTITPMLTTSKLLHCKTTVTMFLPMSCTSPLTVAITILPLLHVHPGGFLLALFFLDVGDQVRHGAFMTRALFTTWGRNILPWPTGRPRCSCRPSAGLRSRAAGARPWPGLPVGLFRCRQR